MALHHNPETDQVKVAVPADGLTLHEKAGIATATLSDITQLRTGGLMPAEFGNFSLTTDNQSAQTTRMASASDGGQQRPFLTRDMPPGSLPLVQGPGCGPSDMQVDEDGVRVRVIVNPGQGYCEVSDRNKKK